MSSLILSQQQKDVLRKYAKEFVTWIDTEKGRHASLIHRDHERYFKQKLSSENITKMTQEEFSDLFKKVWANNVFQNKDWYIKNKLISPNGFDKLKNELVKLLYGHENIVLRYNNFRENMTGFGASTISEILHFLFPESYCLWNDKPKTVLPFLGLKILPEKFFKSQIKTGEEYYQCVQALNLVREELKEFGITDFVELDILLWHIYDDIIRVRESEIIDQEEQITKLPRIIIDSHESAEYYLLELGKMLGYTPHTVDQSKTFNGHKLGDAAILKQIPAFAGERDLGSAREIDVIWFGDDENPKLCFEVEHTTDIVHGLNRLSQLQHLYVKFFIVAFEDRRAKFNLEMEKYPFRRMKESFGFISYDELSALYETSIPFYELKIRLLGEN